ncbi:MAG: pyruvate, phosphate dikinase [Deltaproteobacteria bacterium]|nr:MAG: pyruvate, phosphate dikinase [Deltaproteobacteria bacterium]
MPRKYVYAFGDGEAEGHGEMKDLLGGKGAGLAEMTRAGIPVPPGFTITTEVCNLYQEAGRIPPEPLRQIDEALQVLEARRGKRLGAVDDPLLVSVRSGAKISMPGMMDTILNLGLNDASVEGLAAQADDPRFAYDSYRRLLQMYGDVVLHVPHAHFDAVLEEARQRRGVRADSELPAEDLKEIVERFKAIIAEEGKGEFPQDPKAQLLGAIEAVFGSWNNERARRYRQIHEIPDDLGTACTVQAMVFGNLGDDSATGVGFTRNPATGARELYGEFLLNAQGEDVVAGIRTPRPLKELAEVLPEAYAELEEIALRLERHYGDMQDFEFTIERRRLFMLQTRTGKRTGIASVVIATDMVDEGLITREEAVIRVEPVQLLQLLHPVFDPAAREKATLAARGLAASPGAATGVAVFDADRAVERAEAGETVILVRKETSPEDIHGMHAAAGILTALGGMTSHAAVVGRQMGKPSVVGCDGLKFLDERTAKLGEYTLHEGDPISIDGTTGEVILGRVETMPSEVVQVITGQRAPEESALFQAFDRLMAWADLLRRLGVRANADRAEDAALALAFGAEGIGLARTEHMFLGPGRVERVREMIMARDAEARRAALDKLLPMQRADFEALFRTMQGWPVTIRTLDPPLHEFLPDRVELSVQVAVMKAKGETHDADGRSLEELERLLARVEELTEFNPMLGWRGCRLGIMYPEITETQARALFEAAAACIADGIEVHPELMIPLVGIDEELRRQKAIVDEVAKQVMKEKGVHIPYKVGTMIEVPRGAITAGAIARTAEFFSFGTNDLTQTTFGFSRDDAQRFLGYYVEERILPRNPFVSIDREGVGELMRWAVEKGRAARQDLKVGICGEHGGDPQSVGFCHDLGLDYVSCSPYRIPVARLAAAQAVLHERGVEELRARARRNLRAKAPPTYHEAARGRPPRSRTP